MFKKVLATAGLLMLAGSAAHAQVVPGDTFTFAVAGFNSASGVGYILGSGYTSTFGTTQTIQNAGYNGQSYTITSGETVGLTTITDTFTVSTPTSFITSTAVNGTTITALQFDLGDGNSGVGVTTGADPVNVLLPLSSVPTATGYMVYSTSTQFTLSPGVTLVSPTSYSAAEGVNTGTAAISAYNVHQFTMAITYALVAAPEPSEYAAFGLGLLGLGGLALKARRRSVVA